MERALGGAAAQTDQVVSAAEIPFEFMMNALRLNGAQYARVEAAEVAVHIRAVKDLWTAVLGPISPGT